MTMMHQPLIGWKRGTPAVNAPPRLFLLANIEGPAPPPQQDGQEPVTPARLDPEDPAALEPVPIPTPTGILVPPVWPETLTAFAQWDYPGNPYFDNRALKLRAIVTATVKMIMLDNYFESNPDSHRADVNAYKLACFGKTYLGTRELLPPEVQQAYETGLLRLGRMMLEWGTRGEEPNDDLSLPVGLYYVTRCCEDAAFAEQVQTLTRKLFTERRHFHPAGYWVERGGGLDVGFAGGANFYAAWLALMTDWPFAQQTVEQAYRLRSHLCLRDPDGYINGPSQFNTRLGSPTSSDQWHWDGARDQAAAMVGDEALPFIKQPTAELLSEAGGNRAKWFNSQIKQNPVRPDLAGRKSALRTGYWANEDLRSRTWTWRMWQTYNFPIGINPGYDFYRAGSYERLAKLLESDSPKLRLPYDRGERFVRNFEDAFVTTRQADYAAILHTGEVGTPDPDDGLPQYPGPMGFGGGQLSADWTPKTGSVILGRRIGMRYDGNYDTLESWRQWPIHAISGSTPQGTVFSSARNAKPAVEMDLTADGGTSTASGTLAAVKFAEQPPLPGAVQYRRTFAIEADGLKVTSSVTGDGQLQAAELYETVPVFLIEAKRQAKTEPTRVEFQIDNRWQPAGEEFVEQVSAVRLARFDGAVTITFDKPQRVRLGETWSDTYLTRAQCRNLLVDLLAGAESPVAFKQAAVSSRIAPAH